MTIDTKNQETNEHNLRLIDRFEVGGSFFELIEFSLTRHLPGGQRIQGIYGVNVAKVREVVRLPKINPLGSSIPGIAGVFELRGVPIPAINLCQVLGDSEIQHSSDQQIIVTEFSDKRAGFVVSTTHRIRRVAWEKVLAPSSDSGSFMSGMILIENNEFLFILDLEKILHDIETGSHMIPRDTPRILPPPPQKHKPAAEDSSGESSTAENGAKQGILLVDDSRLIQSNVSKALSEAGFRVQVAENGKQALELLLELVEGQTSFGSLDAVITDVEMPQMDGITLTNNIRRDSRLKHLPIILHSSLSGEATQSEAKEAGANGYVVKNDIKCLMEMLNQVLPSG